jgi:preprotein translocase subunit SecG
MIAFFVFLLSLLLQKFSHKEAATMSEDNNKTDNQTQQQNKQSRPQAPILISNDAKQLIGVFSQSSAQLFSSRLVVIELKTFLITLT